MREEKSEIHPFGLFADRKDYMGAIAPGVIRVIFFNSCNPWILSGYAFCLGQAAN
jgi:hypothetical protein